MKHTLKYLLAPILLSNGVGHANCPSNTVVPKFTVRSPGANVARRVINSTKHTQLYNMDAFYGTLSVTPEYKTDEMARCLFGDFLQNDCILKVQGSRAKNRDGNALLADYFYLPTDFSSTVSIKPRIRSFLVDFNVFFGLDQLAEGFYF